MTLRDYLLLLGMALAFLGSSTSEPRPTSAHQQGREGTITHMGPGYPVSYLAIPIGPGIRVKVCGPARCLSMTSTDAGPNRAMLQAGRIADVSVQTFERLCSCPASTGVFHGSWSRVGPGMTLPPTDSGGAS